jgi:hypothetical protein
VIAARSNSTSPPNRSALCVIALLGVYTLTILAIEAQSSQDVVRYYLSDVSETEPLFAINTTLSVTLLWAAALLFAVAARLPRTESSGWLWSQAAIFLYLGIDDRFLLHETLSRLFRIGDHYFLLSVALLEVGLLVYGWRRGLLSAAAARCLMQASMLFAGMWVIDAFAPHDLRLRLSVEDLCKTWSCYFFARFAWVTLFSRIAALPAEGHPEARRQAIALRLASLNVEASP